MVEWPSYQDMPLPFLILGIAAQFLVRLPIRYLTVTSAVKD